MQIISSTPTQDNTISQEEQTQTDTTIDISETEATDQTQTEQKSSTRARQFIQQTLQQYDTTPHKKTNVGEQALTTYHQQSSAYTTRTSIYYNLNQTKPNGNHIYNT
jgi:hypothetical protein